MANIESIKQKILQLDAGSFQNLCDSYLYKTGYPSIVSLGGEAGTRKTTLGTPDTYFIASNGKYVFVEYTTQRTNLFAKISDDLKKCLDTAKTGVPHDKISEIIYCHTSSNLTPFQDSEVKKLCEGVGVKLIIIGIDKLAEDIYLFHHNLSRDFLGISISTDQIQSYDEFINSYNANRMAAPIDTKFLFREKEFQDIINAYLKVDVVILSGSSGTGKTRLALHYVKNHADAKNEKTYCIHSNALPIYEDLKLFLDRPGDYFLFIDDANQLSGLQYIIRYVSMKPEGYNVKILITVRDYALQKVINDVRAITSYEIVNVNVFSEDEIREILSSYGGTIDDVSIPVLQFDLKYIKLILESYFLPDKLINCLLANEIVQVFSRMNCSCESLFSEYFEEESFQLYRLLKGPEYKEVGYEEHEKWKQQLINQYTSNCDLQMFKKLIDVCSGISELDNHSSWEVGEGLNIAFDSISDKKNLYVDAIKYYIKNDTPHNLHPYHLVDTLFSLLSDLEVYEIIISEEYSQKNAWTYAYYHELPLELITEKHLQELYDFLKDTSDRYITSSSMRDVDFLEKYNVIDELALIEGCKIILDKKEYSSFIVDIYFCLLFNYHHNTPKEVIQKFNCNFELLEEIYYAMLSYDKHHDYDGQFLKEIYSVRPSILDKYIDYLINSDSFSDHQEKHCCFFDLDDFVEIYNKIFEQLIRNRRYSKFSVPDFLESLLLPKQNEKKMLERQDMWIRQCIQRFCNDEAKMYCLFSVVLKLEFKRKKEYILLFLENNPLFEDFEKIPLTPTFWSWSGSAVPIYSAWIEFLESLLPNCIGLKWIKHKNYIETKIGYLKERIESEQINEILRG